MVIFSLIYCCFTLFNTISANPSNIDNPVACPKIIRKSQWGGRPALAVEYAIIPVKNVVIHHTATHSCDTEVKCKEFIKSAQNYHMDELDFHDIAYNFLIGGDGNVYEGAGWHKVGAHTRGYNSRSIGIGFIGNFQDVYPSKNMLDAVQQLLACAVEMGELDVNYKLFGARQVSATVSPGSRLYTVIKKWPHYTTAP